MRIAISSGHGLHVPGAHTIHANEVLEARRITQDVARRLRIRSSHQRPLSVFEFHDDNSRNQNDNLNNIIGWHNGLENIDCHVSVHFNAVAGMMQTGIGVETWFREQSDQPLAAHVTDLIAGASGLRNRGARNSTQLRFLNMVRGSRILLEIAFINSDTDMRLYRNNYEAICDAIVDGLLS